MKRLILASCLFFFAGFIQAESVALSPVQYQQLHKINEALAADAQEEALNLGETLFKQPQGTPEQQAFVRAFVARALVQVYQQKDQSKKALAQLQKVLKEDSEYLDLSSLQAVRWITLHLLTGENQYTSALKLLEIWWQDEEQPSAEANYLRAALLAQLEKWQAAEPWLLNALEVRQPDSWLSLGVAIFQRQEKWANAAKLQHQRLVLTPEKQQLWGQLAQLQLLAEQDKQALVTLELAQEKGYLNNKEQVQLARRLLADQQPLRAATIFEAQLANQPDNLKLNKLAAQAWLQTSNKQSTQQALERLAKLSQATHDWQRLGEWNFRQGNWQAAITAWQKITDKLEGKEKARLELLIANAYIEMQAYALAKPLLENLLASNEAAAAKQWLNYLKAL
ncbi:MAG TPA: hypothetical protein VJY63_02510 [Marinospirillum sp.]|uniref:tetratricopeptide repeat protein n=1 Tax=Marinospirillum sp. TaxID=2183934 RepID=UPI002B476DAE|nr:hypothetical protein [Marinospirillum sp.]HKM14786.1 hypothetical protein [Marinospirillum sp.]